MKKQFIFLVLLNLFVTPSFILTAQNNCTHQPRFVQQLGFELNRSGFSTSDRRRMGIVFAEFKDPQNPVEYTRLYQDSTWMKAGFLGSIVFDKEGNVYVAPLPVVNILNNPVIEKNTIFRIDHATGKMEKFVELPVSSKYNSHNPFGIIGITYDCDLHSIFVSTLEGSDEKNELGKIFSISLPDKNIKLILDNTDALGLATFTLGEMKRLYFGKARTSEIYSLNIDDSLANFESPKLEIDISGIGPRGDDKARKIKFQPNGLMQIFAVEFEYNLVAPTERQESICYFQFNKSSKIWYLNQQQ